MEFDPHWQELLLYTSAASVFVFLATLAAVPWVVARLPHDYFARDRRTAWRSLPAAPVYTLFMGLLKNLLGSVLVVLGVIMLVTPGQGLLTLMTGLLLMNFPGKYHLERWLVTRRGVLRGLNWLRGRRGQAPFDAPQGHDFSAD
ncbi:MAG: PGPGW domain-containing protein [Halioglobus sp.]